MQTFLRDFFVFLNPALGYHDDFVLAILLFVFCFLLLLALHIIDRLISRIRRAYELKGTFFSEEMYDKTFLYIGCLIVVLAIIHWFYATLVISGENKATLINVGVNIRNQ